VVAVERLTRSGNQLDRVGGGGSPWTRLSRAQIRYMCYHTPWLASRRQRQANMPVGAATCLIVAGDIGREVVPRREGNKFEDSLSRIPDEHASQDVHSMGAHVLTEPNANLLVSLSVSNERHGRSSFVSRPAVDPRAARQSLTRQVGRQVGVKTRPTNRPTRVGRRASARAALFDTCAHCVWLANCVNCDRAGGQMLACALNRFDGRDRTDTFDASRPMGPVLPVNIWFWADIDTRPSARCLAVSKSMRQPRGGRIGGRRGLFWNSPCLALCVWLRFRELLISWGFRRLWLRRRPALRAHASTRPLHSFQQ
jgi:hypothetical protein